MYIVLSLLYVYLVYFIFNDHFWFTRVRDYTGENGCINMLQCFLNKVNFSIRSSGAFGDVLIQISYFLQSKGLFLIRYLYDFFDFIIVKIIFVTLVFSVMINSFKSNRQINNIWMDDRSNICFICQLHRSKFDK